MRIYSPIPITRAGVALPGSPFQARAYLSAFPGQRHEAEPDVMKTQTSRVLTFQNIAAPVQVGDIATLTDGTSAKILNIRKYDRTLQCDLEIIPFQLVTMWVLTVPTARIDALTNLKGALYVNAGTVLAYIEPMADMTAALSAMNMDVRSARVFTAAPLLARSVIKSDADYWITKTGSEHWPVTNDYIAILSHLNELPSGVT